MKVSASGITIALTKVRKEFTIHSARKTTVSKLKKANVIYCKFRIYRHCHRCINFLNDYDEADEEERR